MKVLFPQGYWRLLNLTHLLYHRARWAGTAAAASEARSDRAAAAPPLLTRATAPVHGTGRFGATRSGGVCALEAASDEKLKELPCRGRERVLGGAVQQRAEDLEQASTLQDVVVFRGKGCGAVSW